MFNQWGYRYYTSHLVQPDIIAGKALQPRTRRMCDQERCRIRDISAFLAETSLAKSAQGRCIVAQRSKFESAD